MKKIIALLIVTATLFAICVPASAANRTNVKKYEYYAAIGDSISAGYEIDLVRESELPYYSAYGRVSGAYPDLIGQYTSFEGEDNYHSLTMPGFRSIDFCYLLGGKIDDKNYEQNSVDFWRALNVMMYGKTMPLEESEIEDLGEDCFIDYIYDNKESLDMISYIKNADLITIGVGSNDIVTTGLVAQDIYKRENPDGEDGAIAMLEAMLGGVLSYRRYMDRSLEIVARNKKSDCDVVLIGMFNPFENLVFDCEDGELIKAVVAVYFRAYNAATKAFARKYGFTYADVSQTCDYSSQMIEGIVSGETTDDVLEELGDFFTHPDYAGHEYIADCILSVLPDTLVQTSLRTGNLEMKINGKNVGMFGFTKEQDGWLIRDLDSGLYLTFLNGEITLSQSGTLWQYNGGFYTETTAKFGILKRVKRNYISLDKDVITTSQFKKNATFYKAS